MGRVVQRVDTAKEGGSGHLDLSECQLTQVPDAVFLLMKSVTLQSCSLASNLITKIPAKLPINFTLIKELNLSNNRVSVLPSCPPSPPPSPATTTWRTWTSTASSSPAA